MSSAVNGHEAGRAQLPALGARFRFLFGVTGMSNLADGLLLIGVPLLALTFTRSPAQIALLSAAFTLPWLLLSLYVGVLVDRYDRVRLLSIAMSVRALVLAAAAAAGVAGQLTMPVLIGLLVVLGTAEVFADSAATVLVPAVVPRSRLAAANSRVMGVQMLMNAFVGGPLAGLVLGLGVGWFFGLSAGLCVVALVLVRFGLSGRVEGPVRSGPSTSFTADLKEGLRFLFGHEVLRPLLIGSTVMNFANAGYFAVYVLWVVGPQSTVGLDSQLYGVLLGSIAVGAILGAVATDRLQRWVREARLIGVTWMLNSALLLVTALVPDVWVIGLAFVVVGFTNMVSNVTYASLRQRLVPDSLRGRTGGASRMLGYGCLPIGASLAGIIAEATGVGAVLIGASAVALLAVAWAVSQVTQRMIDSADASAQATEALTTRVASDIDTPRPS